MFEKHDDAALARAAGVRNYPEAMPLTSHDAAREVRRRLPGVGLKKLHKLLYYCQGHHLAATGEPLFEESISAWDMGPVVGRLWRQEHDAAPPPVPRDPDESQLNTIGYVVSRYGQLSGRDLEHLTHAEDPWRRANARRPAGQSVRIERAWMHDYFSASAIDEDEDELGTLDAAVVTQWLAPARGRSEDALEVDTIESLRARLTNAG